MYHMIEFFMAGMNFEIFISYALHFCGLVKHHPSCHRLAFGQWQRVAATALQFPVFTVETLHCCPLSPLADRRQH